MWISSAWRHAWTLINCSNTILVHHICKLDVLFLSLDLVKILYCIPRSAKLDENHRGLFDCNVPIILKIKHELPNWKWHKLWVFAEEFEIFGDFDLGEVIREPTEGTQDVQTSSLGLWFLRGEQVQEHRQHYLLQFTKVLLVYWISRLVCLRHEISDIYLEHWADQTITDWTDVTPGWV